MSEQEFYWWLGITFIGALALLGLFALHGRAGLNRSELDEVLMRNGDDDE